MRNKSARRIVVVALTALALSATVPHVEATQPPRSVFEVEGRYRDVVFAPGAVDEVENIQYGRAVNWKGEWEDLLLDVHYVPNDGAAFRPAVVWVHGGYFLEGSKDISWYQGSIAELAQSGYVVVAINYRLQGGDFPYGLGGVLTTAEFDEYIGAITQAQHDAQAAIRWVRLHAADYDIDPNRVAIVGHSAGGLTATAVAMNADDDPGNSGSPGPSSVPNAAVAMAGGGLPGRQLRIDPGDAPILFVHGLADDVVPYVAVPPVCAATIAVGNVCEQVLDPDQDHGTFGYPEIREYLYRWIVQRPGLILPTNLTLVP